MDGSGDLFRNGDVVDTQYEHGCSLLPMEK